MLKQYNFLLSLFAIIFTASPLLAQDINQVFGETSKIPKYPSSIKKPDRKSVV